MDWREHPVSVHGDEWEVCGGEWLTREIIKGVHYGTCVLGLRGSTHLL
jgi:hypothetical protein